MRERETRRFDDSVENGSGEQRVGVVQCVDLRRGTKEGEDLLGVCCCVFCGDCVCFACWLAGVLACIGLLCFYGANANHFILSYDLFHWIAAFPLFVR